MKDFKKRTLILMLASVVTVTGSFAADNYKNCLMDLVFKATGPNEINVVLNTKKPYDDSLTSRKIDGNTYVIMLPEFDNAAPTPNLSDSNGNIESVDIKKMPYSNGSKGYTKILIKTTDNINLNASTTLYIPSAETREITTSQSREEDNLRERQESISRPVTSTIQSPNTPTSTTRPTPTRETRQVRSEEPVRERQYETYPTESKPIATTPQDDISSNDEIDETSEQENLSQQAPDNGYQTSENSAYQKFLISLMALLIIFVSIYIFIKAKNKITDVIGESLNIDIDDKTEKKERKSAKKGKTKRSTKNFNSEYTGSENIQLKSLMDEPISKEPPSDEDTMNVVDLDALYKEQAVKNVQSNDQESETDALDDFLNGFVFEEDQPKTQENQEDEAESSYSEEDYKNVINSPDMLFTEDDMECFKELLQSEINDSTIKNIKNYAQSNPIPPQKPSPEKLLENIVTEYAISQDIIFTAADIKIIRQLLSVEIDENFVKDLRTNPKRTKEMEKEILDSKNQKASPANILTLKVKNILPNLKDAMKKQGNKPIVSEAKPETVYFSEGYEVSTLSIDDALPDLSKELKNKKAFDSKPSDLGPIVDQTYSNSVEKLSISGLPDLQDVMANPDKYAEPEKEEVIPDEQALLNSILNVQFKPFDDGTRQFEIINDIVEDESPEETPSVEDIRKEFSQFNNFEVTTEDESEGPYTYRDYDDFEALYDETYVDLDLGKNKPKDKNISQNKSKSVKKKIRKPDHFVPMDLKRVEPVSSKHGRVNKSAELIKMIKATKEKKEVTKAVKKTPASVQNHKPEIINNEKQQTVKCILDGVNYNVIGTAEINTELGCHLAKSNGKYIILAYSGDNLSVIKSYESLKTEKIAARLSETLADGTPRYLVKVGANKFIIDIKDGKINYVMDLC